MSPLCWTWRSSSLRRLVFPRRRAPTTHSESPAFEDVLEDPAAAEEVLAADPASGDEGVAHRLGGLVCHSLEGVALVAGGPRLGGPALEQDLLRTAYTSAAVMVVRPSSRIRFTAWMQNFWMR